MRCIHCLTDNNYRERQANNGRCSKCGRAFAFEPKTSAGGITDKLVSNAIQDVSASQTLYFTEQQFFAVLERKIASSNSSGSSFQQLLVVSLIFGSCFSLGPIGVLLSSVGVPELVFPLYILFLMVLLFFYGPPFSRLRMATIGLIYVLAVLMIVYAVAASQPLNVSIISLLVAGIGVGLGIIAYRRSLYYKPSTIKSKSLQILRQFLRVHGGGEKLLPPISSFERLYYNDTAALVQTEDLRPYSFDRVLFCEHKSTVQLLIANHFHFEHNCAVLTPDGYPYSVSVTAIQMLKSNPSLKVFCLHDCSPAGMFFLSKLLAAQPWLQETNLPICDLGLLPRQIMKNPRRFFVCRQMGKNRKPVARIQLHDSIVSRLQPREVKWLSQGFYVDVESIPPQRLLQFLARGVLEQITPEQLEPEAFPFLGNPIIYMGVDSFG